ncbi:energy transducer TonB [Reinekea sp.]|uniref:energy transducer TonB n=1 Tax=Reinekea sp. TaxID=1970455 RepID=UPI00398A3C00
MNLDTVNPLVTEPQPKNRAILITIGVSVLLHMVILSQNFLETSQAAKSHTNEKSATLSLTVIKPRPVIDRDKSAQDNPVKSDSESAEYSEPSREVITTATKSIASASPKVKVSTLSDEAVKLIEPSEVIHQKIQQALPETPLETIASEEKVTPTSSNAQKLINHIESVEQTETETETETETTTAQLIEKTSIIKFSLPRFKGNTPIAITPTLAQRKRQFGRVIVRGYVNGLGKLEQTTVYQSSGYEILDDSALEQASQWQYAPASNGFEASGHWVEIPIEFR